MMLQNVNIALSVVLCGCLLSGCNNSTTSASSSVSSPSTSDYESRWGYKVVTDGSDSVPFIEDHYTLYNVSFDEFSERIHSIFTDNCLTSTDYAIKFKNYNGRVAVHFSLHNEMVAGMTIYVQEQYPDTYRLVKNTPEKVEFTLISHYDRDGSVENPLEVYIIEYPIRMVKTDYGWRIDDFHTSRYG